MCCCCQNSSFPGGWAVPTRRREENFLSVLLDKQGKWRQIVVHLCSRQQVYQLSSAPAPSLQCASQSREGKKRKEGKRPFLTTNKQTNKQRRVGPGCKLSTWSAHLLCLLAVILIVAFCALIWIRLVVIILLLHLLAGDIESNN